MLEKTSQTQLKRLHLLQHKIKQHERKQKQQMRTIDQLNNSATQLYGAAGGGSVQDGGAAAEATASKLDDMKVENMLRERNNFIESCRHNRFYANPNYEEPWRIFSKLSEKLANEIVGNMEQDFTSGVSKFVQDFLELETKT